MKQNPIEDALNSKIINRTAYPGNFGRIDAGVRIPDHRVNDNHRKAS
jgi:hypothetical protein